MFKLKKQKIIISKVFLKKLWVEAGQQVLWIEAVQWVLQALQVEAVQWPYYPKGQKQGKLENEGVILKRIT